MIPAPGPFESELLAALDDDEPLYDRMLTHRPGTISHRADHPAAVPCADAEEAAERPRHRYTAPSPRVAWSRYLADDTEADVLAWLSTGNGAE